MSTEYVPRILLGLVVIYIGFTVVTKGMRLLNKNLEKREIGDDLRPFLISLAKVVLKMLILVSAAGIVGIETSSFVAVIAAAGFAVGLALQGSLGNLAGGILILLFKPFRSGDYIIAQGKAGFVQEIQIFNTILLTHENRRVTIPNGILSNGVIENMTDQEIIRIDLTFGIGYTDDIDKARRSIESCIESCPTALDGHKHPVHLTELADSSVNFTAQIWVKNKDYLPTKFFMLEAVKKAFDRENIGIPFPQMDVHLKNS